VLGYWPNRTGRLKIRIREQSYRDAMTTSLTRARHAAAVQASTSSGDPCPSPGGNGRRPVAESPRQVGLSAERPGGGGGDPPLSPRLNAYLGRSIARRHRREACRALDATRGAAAPGDRPMDGLHG
jgi:hypothetical protein